MPRKARIDWIEFALAVLAREGSAALLPETLSARAGLTRGAFYHRFASVDAFQSELLSAWQQRNTQAVIDASLCLPEGDRRRAGLAALAAGIDHDLDRAVRAWALADPRARAAVHEVDALRIAWVRECLPAEQPQREALAEALYLVYVGAQQVRAELDDAGLLALLEPVDRWLLSGAGPATALTVP